MRNILNLLLLLIIPGISLAENRNHLVIQFQLPAKSKASLFYPGKAYEFKTIVFKNTASHDSVIVVKVELDNNVVLRSSYASRKDGSFNFSQDYLLPPLNDTAKLTLGKNSKLISLNNKSLIINDEIQFSDQMNRPTRQVLLTSSFEAFNNQINAIHDANKALINSGLDKGTLNERAARTLQQFADADYYQQLLAGALIKKRFEQVKSDLKLFTSSIKKLQSNHTELTLFLFEKYVKFLIGRDDLNPDDLSTNFKYAFATGWQKDVTLGFLHEQLSDYSPKSNATFKSCFQQFKNFAGPEYKAQVDTLERSYFPVIRQMEKIYLVNKLGQKMSLKNVFAGQKGKIILVDFWASWCVPCRQESPLFEAAKRKYINQGIAFVNFSLDNDDKSADWLKALKEDKLLTAANHYKLSEPKRSLLFQSLTIPSIPRYILMTATGEVLDSDFRRPSDKNFEKELNRYLSKKLQ